MISRFAHRRELLLTGLLASAGLSAPASALANEEAAIVEIESGKLKGRRFNDAVSFKGVPYAADTGGPNRFLAPQAVASWSGVRDADRFGDRCPQAQTGRGDGGDSSPTYGENCCVLNIYTPSLDGAARRPVMFYIHGGGFRSGAGDAPDLDGSALARSANVVIVTVNHRLNALGYANLGLVDERFADAGNAGQLDLVAALRWVQRNIHVFGGDAANVTAFGQSGGGSKISALLVMPKARGLFRRFINMSGSSAFAMRRAPELEAVTLEFLRLLGIARSDTQRLQTIPADRLIAAHDAAFRSLKAGDYRPTIDGRHILHGPLSPEGLAMQAAMPGIMSCTATEASIFLLADPRNLQVSSDQLQDRIARQFSLDAATASKVMAAYRLGDPTRNNWDVLVAVASDSLVRVPMRHAAEAKAKLGRAPLYMAEFNWRTNAQGGILGSPHAIDIPFAFGNLDKNRLTAGAGLGALATSSNEMKTFTSFARVGEPDNDQIPKWEPYEVPDRATLVIDAQCRLALDYRAEDRRASDMLPPQDAFDVLAGPLFRP